MKKILFLFCLCFSLSVSGAWIGDEKVKPIEIEKGEIKKPNEILPRIPVIVPITCSYNDGTLYFTFLEDLGEMQITVTNPSIGVVSVSEYDSAYGNVVVPVSSESGRYLIEIVTESGEYYYGEYEL